MVQATMVSPPKVVRIIEPTIPIHETVKTTYRALRVAAYCRVSTKQEEQLHSYETQVKHYTERIQAENGWILEGIVCNVNIGHALPRCILPFGVEATVDTENQVIRFVN